MSGKRIISLAALLMWAGVMAMSIGCDSGGGGGGKVRATPAPAHPAAAAPVAPNLSVRENNPADGARTYLAKLKTNRLAPGPSSAKSHLLDAPRAPATTRPVVNHVTWLDQLRERLSAVTQRLNAGNAPAFANANQHLRSVATRPATSHPVVPKL